MQTVTVRPYWPAILVAGVIAGCDDVDSDDSVSPKVIGGADAGRVSLALVESPTDRLDQAAFVITAVQFQRVDGELLEIALNPPVVSELPASAVFDDPTVLLQGETLPAGAYSWLRLVFDDTRLFVDVDGRQLPVRLEESLDSALLDFDVVVSEETDLELVVVFDLHRSLIPIFGSQFILRPSLRIVETDLTGTLLGTVDNRLLEADHCANGALNGGSAVYIFAGSDARVQDIRSDLFDPFATATLSGSTAGELEFRADFLPPGEFTVVFTCNALLDDPDLSDSRVVFSDGFNVRIESGQSTRVTIH